jgi:hypothetical protein
MTAGRKPTPTALKLVKGNPGKRAVNKAEAVVALGLGGTYLAAQEVFSHRRRRDDDRFCLLLDKHYVSILIGQSDGDKALAAVCADSGSGDFDAKALRTRHRARRVQGGHLGCRTGLRRPRRVLCKIEALVPYEGAMPLKVAAVADDQGLPLLLRPR